MIKSIIRATEYQLNIKWRLTNCCNYTCSYCVRKKNWDNIENLKNDKELIKNTLPQVKRLITESNKTTRIELIGGEVCLFDLKELLTQLFNETHNLVRRINITSNFSRNASYYNDLINLCNINNVELYLTLSWHKEFISLKDFIDKYNQLIITDLSKVKLEMVSCSNNQDDVNNFINLCNKFNITYIVDPDVHDLNFNQLVIKTSKNDKPGYIITKEDNSIETCNSLRELVKNYGDYNKNKINLNGYYCSLDFNYVYIDKNLHIGYLKDIDHCKVKQPLETFHLLKEPIKCTRGCSLCGYMSVSTDKNELITLVNKED